LSPNGIHDRSGVARHLLNAATMRPYKYILIGAAVLLAVTALWAAALAIALKPKTAPVGISSVSSLAENSRPVTTPKVAPTIAPKPEPTAVSKEAAKRMVTVNYKWTKDGFGTIMMVDFTLTNRSPYSARDITVTCTHYAPSGTEIDSNTRTIYEVVPANGKKVVKQFNMGFIHSQAKSSRCEISDLEM
jgi:hypothetical protein